MVGWVPVVGYRVCRCRVGTRCRGVPVGGVGFVDVEVPVGGVGFVDAGGYL